MRDPLQEMSEETAMNVLEEGTKLTLDFLKLQKVAETQQAVVPVVLQHADTREVLFIGYANSTHGNTCED